MDTIGKVFVQLAQSSGIAMFLADPKALIMVGIACVLLYLAIVKEFEPLLLLPIAFGMLLTNLLGSEVFHEELFAGGHANWSLFGGAVMVNANNLVGIHSFPTRRSSDLPDTGSQYQGDRKSVV